MGELNFERRAVQRRLMQRLRPVLPGIALGTLALMVVAATAPLFAWLMKPLLDGGVSGTQPHYVWLMPLAILAIFLVRGIFTFLSAYLMSWAASRFLAVLRHDLFHQLMRLPDDTFRRLGSAHLINRFVLESTVVSQLTSEVLTTVVRDTLVVFALLGLLLYLSWPLTLVALVLVPLGALATRLIMARLRRINEQTIAMNAQLTQRVSEAVEGQRVIKIFGAFNSEIARFSVVNDRLRRFAIRSTAAAAAIVPITQFVGAFALAVVVAIAISQSTQSGLTVGGFAAFVTAMLQLLQPLKHLAHIAGPYERLMASAQVVFSLLDEPTEREGGQTHLPARATGEVRFERVTHRYAGAERDSLIELDLALQPGKTVALVGPSGSGKTTVVSLLAGFQSPTAGRITLDGISVSDIALTDLRAQLSLVSQDVVLFDGSIAENVSFGVVQPPSQARIEQALEDAQLLDFVRAQPEGLNMPIGENGSRLSGGQRQRLAIARALLRDAPILILDEATSALDNASERALQAALERLMQGRTTLVVAHRLSTIQNADCIVVLDAGVVVEQGTHAQLMAADGAYARLYRLQFNEAAAQLSDPPA